MGVPGVPVDAPVGVPDVVVGVQVGVVAHVEDVMIKGVDQLVEGVHVTPHATRVVQVVQVDVLGVLALVDKP